MFRLAAPKDQFACDTKTSVSDVTSIASSLLVYAVLNAGLICTISAFHPYSKEPWADLSLSSQFLYAFQIFVEALLLVLPVWGLAVILSCWKPRVGLVCGAVLLTVAPVVVFGDVLSYVSLGTRIYSTTTFSVVWPLLKWCSYYTTLTSFKGVWLTAAAYVCFELISWNLARSLKCSAEKISQNSHVASRYWLLGGVAFVMLTTLGTFILLYGYEFLNIPSQMLPRHPLAFTGLLDRQETSVPEPSFAERIRTRRQIERLWPSLVHFETHYRRLAVVTRSDYQPDVVIVLAESLRPEAFHTQHMPRVCEHLTTGLASKVNFSCGNASEFGFFGVLFGLDSVFYQRALRKDWPKALLRLFQQLGYFHAFFGTGCFAWCKMDEFINKSSFDLFKTYGELPYYKRDERVIEDALRLLHREKPYSFLKGKPVLAFVYLYTTHYEYHFDPAQDAVFKPYLDPVTAPPWPSELRPLVANRYWNSVRCLDRLVAPLFQTNAVVVLLGDHGETLGEDGRAIHGNALSFVQIQTPLIIKYPQAETLQRVTVSSHTDVLPTLLDLLHVQVNFPGVLSGRSLLRDTEQHGYARNRSFAVKEHVSEDFGFLESVGPWPLERGSVRFQLDLWNGAFRFLWAQNRLGRRCRLGKIQRRKLRKRILEWLKQLTACGETESSNARTAQEEIALILKQGDSLQRKLAMEFVEKWKARAASVLPALETCLQDSDPQVRNTAWRLILLIHRELERQKTQQTLRSCLQINSQS